MSVFSVCPPVCLYALCPVYVMASLYLPVYRPLSLSAVNCMWMCHGEDGRALPADLFMIWLLISFTGTWESASQIGLQAPLCASVHVCVTEKERNRMHFNTCMHVFVYVCAFVPMYTQVCVWIACAITFVCEDFFFAGDKIVTNCVCDKVCLGQWRGGFHDDCL